MEKLVVLDYSDCSVHFYTVAPEADVNEEYLERLGHHCSNCSWMFGEDLFIYSHNEILK